MADEEQKSDPEGLRPLRLVGTEDVPIAYADAVWISYSADDMGISFYQTKRPIGPRPFPEPLDADCIGRFVLPLRTMKHLHAVLTDMIPRFEAIQAKLFGEKKE